jgi:hypothetical protein
VRVGCPRRLNSLAQAAQPQEEQEAGGGDAQVFQVSQAHEAQIDPPGSNTDFQLHHRRLAAPQTNMRGRGRGRDMSVSSGPNRAAKSPQKTKRPVRGLIM